MCLLWSKISWTGREINSLEIEVRLTRESLNCFGVRSAGLGGRLADLGLDNRRKFDMFWSRISWTGRENSSLGIEVSQLSMACFGARSSDLGGRLAHLGLRLVKWHAGFGARSAAWPGREISFIGVLGVGIRQTRESLACFGARLAELGGRLAHLGFRLVNWRKSR
jgi:hypothetical protein